MSSKIYLQVIALNMSSEKDTNIERPIKWKISSYVPVVTTYMNFILRNEG